MKTLRLEVSPDIAKRVLSEVEKDISERTHTRDNLNEEIARLENAATSLRAQLHSGNGDGEKSRAGENKNRIIEYLRGVGDKGAKLMQIHKATGIPITSASFTLKRHIDNFRKTPKKTWKLVKGLESAPVVAEKVEGAPTT